jgi:hypothetical protein
VLPGGYIFKRAKIWVWYLTFKQPSRRQNEATSIDRLSARCSENVSAHCPGLVSFTARRKVLGI